MICSPMKEIGWNPCPVRWSSDASAARLRYTVTVDGRDDIPSSCGSIAIVCLDCVCRSSQLSGPGITSGTSGDCEGEDQIHVDRQRNIHTVSSTWRTNLEKMSIRTRCLFALMKSSVPIMACSIALMTQTPQEVPSTCFPMATLAFSGLNFPGVFSPSHLRRPLHRGASALFRPLLRESPMIHRVPNGYE
jgi:hypothetical protein